MSLATLENTLQQQPVITKYNETDPLNLTLRKDRHTVHFIPRGSALLAKPLAVTVRNQTHDAQITIGPTIIRTPIKNETILALHDEAGRRISPDPLPLNGIVAVSLVSNNGDGPEWKVTPLKSPPYHADSLESMGIDPVTFDGKFPKLLIDLRCKTNRHGKLLPPEQTHARIYEISNTRAKQKISATQQPEQHTAMKTQSEEPLRRSSQYLIRDHSDGSILHIEVEKTLSINHLLPETVCTVDPCRGMDAPFPLRPEHPIKIEATIHNPAESAAERRFKTRSEYLITSDESGHIRMGNIPIPDNCEAVAVTFHLNNRIAVRPLSGIPRNSEVLLNELGIDLLQNSHITPTVILVRTKQGETDALMIHEIVNGKEKNTSVSYPTKYELHQFGNYRKTDSHELHMTKESPADTVQTGDEVASSVRENIRRQDVHDLTRQLLSECGDKKNAFDIVPFTDGDEQKFRLVIWDIKLKEAWLMFGAGYSYEDGRRNFGWQPSGFDRGDVSPATTIRTISEGNHMHTVPKALRHARNISSKGVITVTSSLLENSKLSSQFEIVSQHEPNRKPGEDTCMIVIRSDSLNDLKTILYYGLKGVRGYKAR